MKRRLLLLFLFFNLLGYAQQNKITFTYDAAGNQTSRIYCLNCSGKQAKEIKEIEALVDEDLQKFFPEDIISYYPNPVKEELYLKWEMKDDYVLSVVVYNINGQILKSHAAGESINTLNIPFAEYASGVYIIALNYKKGDQKTIKIIKQ